MVRAARIATAAFVGATMIVVAPMASAGVVTFDFSGSNVDSSYSGSVRLDVSGGQATSGTGLVSGLGYTNVPMVLITTATPGNETAGGPSYPVGFRDNFGTDLYGADTDFPLDSVGGLLFDVDTTTAVWGQFPLLNLYQGGTLFTGTVNSIEYYAVQGSLTVSNVSSVPEPASWALMVLGLGAVGGALRTTRRRQAAFAA
jgi:hypothetical protein